MIGGLDEMDLDAVTMRPQPRASFVAGCDWAQTTEDVTLFVALPADARARDLKVQIDATELRASLRDGRPLLGGALGGECDPGESEWEVRAGELVVSLTKARKREWSAPIDLRSFGEAISAEPPAVAAAAPPVPPTASTRRQPSPAAAATPAASPPPAAALPPAAAPPPAAAARPPAAADGAKSGLGAKYDSWNKFDEDEETLRLENEGKGDEPGWELRGGKGAASISCTEYKKDKEEVSLDRDLADSTKKLQVAFNRRLRDAAEFKTQGNEAMRVGNHTEAYELYNDAADGVEMMHQSAAPLLSSRLSETVRQLRRDCHANAAQAALKLEEWDAAVHHATQALAAEPAHPKALFRRASALHSRAKGAADATQARADLEQLIALQPDNAAAKKLLASLLVG